MELRQEHAAVTLLASPSSCEFACFLEAVFINSSMLKAHATSRDLRSAVLLHRVLRALEGTPALVHCTVEPTADADVVFPVEFNSQQVRPKAAAHRNQARSDRTPC